MALGRKIFRGGWGGANQDFLKLRGASLVLSCVELIVAHLGGGGGLLGTCMFG